MITYSDPEVGYTTEDYLWDGEETPDVFLRIGGRDLNYIGNTLRVKHAIDRRCTARFAIEADEHMNFQEGENIVLRIRKQRVFSGVLQSPMETWPGPESRVYQVEGVCYFKLADDRIITRSFQNMTVGQIITAIVNDDLGADGITPGTIEDGPNVTEAVFSYVSASRAINKLAQAANFHWHIDALRRLDCGPINLFPAPFELDNITEFADKAKSAKSNREYRNRQFIRGGKSETTETLEEAWTGDGEQKTFVTGFPIAREPVVTLNSNPQTIAVKGIGDENAQWFWARGSTEVTQNQNDTPIDSMDLLEISYKGLFDLVAVSTNQGEVQRRQAIQGFGTGMVDAVETDPTLTNANAAFEYAAGKLAKFGVEGKSLTWETERTGLRPNQTIVVNMPQRGYDGDMLLIAEVDIQDRADRIIHTIRAVEGPDDGDWATWFNKITTFPDPVSFRENISEEETLSIFAPFPENWSWLETFDATLRTCFLADGSYSLPTSTETYNENTITYSDASTAYFGDGVDDLEVCC